MMNVHDEKISQLLAKYRLKITCGREEGCREVSFCQDDGFWRDVFSDDDRYNGFGMSEEMAAPILAVIEDVIPYSYDYYYDWLPVRKPESKLIYERMQDVRLKVFNSPFDSSLGKIAERLKYSEFAYDRRVERSARDYQEQALNLRRIEMAALYKLFMKWLHPAEGVFVDFWVSGP